jgi:small subunit ribosomal protein S21
MPQHEDEWQAHAKRSTMSCNWKGAHSESFCSRQQRRSGPQGAEKEIQREGLFREIKRRRAYEKPSERTVRKRAEAIRRGRKAARKLAEREGLISNPRTKRVTIGRR